MASAVFSLHWPIAAIDYGAVGGYILLLDLCLFTMVASFWEAAGGSPAPKRRRAPPKR